MPVIKPNSSLFEDLERLKKNELPFEPKKELVYPRANRDFRCCAQGYYPKGYPEGAVISSSRTDGSETAKQFFKHQNHIIRINNWVIDKSGEVFQPTELNFWGNHLPPCYHINFGEDFDDRVMGIVLLGGEGPYKKLSKRCRKDSKDFYTINRCHDNLTPGYYRSYTDEQLDSLFTLLLWLHENNPRVFKIANIFGKDEIAGPRQVGRWHDKSPGCALRGSTSQFRMALRRTVDQRRKNLLQPQKRERRYTDPLPEIKAVFES